MLTMSNETGKSEHEDGQRLAVALGWPMAVYKIPLGALLYVCSPIPAVCLSIN